MATGEKHLTTGEGSDALPHFFEKMESIEITRFNARIENLGKVTEKFLSEAKEPLDILVAMLAYFKMCMDITDDCIDNL